MTLDITRDYELPHGMRITVVISRRGVNVDFTRDYEYLMG